jgi:hypothetical protein
MKLTVVALVMTGGFSAFAQTNSPLTARDYFNELKAANSFSHYSDTFVCFMDNDTPAFAVISRGSDIIDEMKSAGASANKLKTMLPVKSLLFVEKYYKGVGGKMEEYEPVGKDGTEWDAEFTSPFHGRMRYSINWTTGRYRFSVYALDRSKTLAASENFGKCELIHPGDRAM